MAKNRSRTRSRPGAITFGQLPGCEQMFTNPVRIRNRQNRQTLKPILKRPLEDVTKKNQLLKKSSNGLLNSRSLGSVSTSANSFRQCSLSASEGVSGLSAGGGSLGGAWPREVAQSR